LVANVVHDSPPGQEKKEGVTSTKRAGKDDSGAPPGSYRVHVVNRASDQWYEMQDLFVQETLPQLITISESCILIYEKKQAVANHRARMGFD
jgi:U4/U6.U5 tri-snRNP-associated protein 2